MNAVFVIMIAGSFIFSFFNKTVQQTTDALLSSGTKALEIIFSFAGIMCMWSGILKVAKNSGLLEKVSKITEPLLKRLFPNVINNKNVMDNICANISANLLGVGNAATPAGIMAMEEMDKINKNPKIASEEMSIFVVMNTASMQLIPTTVIGMRKAYLSSDPQGIIFCVWISSFLSVAGAIILMKWILHIRKGKLK